MTRTVQFKISVDVLVTSTSDADTAIAEVFDGMKSSGLLFAIDAVQPISWACSSVNGVEV